MNAALNRPGRHARRIGARWHWLWVSTCQVTFVLLAASGWPSLARAGDPNRAGLVIQFAAEQIETRCVEFDGEEITGADLLTRSGLRAVVDPSSGLGITVCQIEGQGCNYPAEPCFCQCSGSGPCAYWNYYYREPGQHSWTYAALGALRHTVRPGSVEAWVWGDGTAPPAAGLTFETVCPSLTLAATSLATSPPHEPAVQQATAIGLATLEPTQTQPTETSTPMPVPSSMEQGPGLEGQEGTSAYWLFGGLVLILVLAGVIVWLRNRRVGAG
jgi:hypothetical protein